MGPLYGLISEPSKDCLYIMALMLEPVFKTPSIGACPILEFPEFDLNLTKKHLIGTEQVVNSMQHLILVQVAPIESGMRSGSGCLLQNLTSWPTQASPTPPSTHTHTSPHPHTESVCNTNEHNLPLWFYDSPPPPPLLSYTLGKLRQYTFTLLHVMQSFCATRSSRTLFQASLGTNPYHRLWANEVPPEKMLTTMHCALVRFLVHSGGHSFHAHANMVSSNKFCKLYNWPQGPNC